MKLTSVFVGVAMALLAGCGHDHSASMPPPSSPPPPPPPSTNINVTTGQLLTNYAQQSAETAQPLAVDGGAFAITDTSETSAPITVSSN